MKLPEIFLAFLGVFLIACLAFGAMLADKTVTANKFSGLKITVELSETDRQLLRDLVPKQQPASEEVFDIAK